LATSIKAEEILVEVEPVSFGWFKKLDNEQMSMYTGSMIHALMNAETGAPVRWRTKGAKGTTVILMTIPNGHGYCRVMYHEVTAFGKTKSGKQNYCYSNTSRTWSRREIY